MRLPKALGQPIEPQRQDLAPLDGAWKQKNAPNGGIQRDRLDRMNEDLRLVGIHASRGDDVGAVETLLMLLRKHRLGVFRFADMQLGEAGLAKHLVRDLESHDVRTLADLANCQPFKLTGIDILHLITALQKALKKVVEIERDRAG